MLRLAFAVLLVCASLVCAAEESRRPNILLILADDHRYDAMGFMGHPFLETPHMDRLAREGVHCANAFVTTALCSPSRASILTGLYAHTHGVVDNYHPVNESLIFFPQLLQKAGYATAFIGKWHMGETDQPQRGFDHWVAFKGQGSYWPDGRGTTRVVPQTSLEGLNINGRRVEQKGYITDELTDYAADWIKGRGDQPWFCYVSHKAVHSDFVAADRHKGRYKDRKLVRPPTFPDSAEVYRDKPMWLKNQRNSRHGVDFAYNLDNFDLDTYYQRYCETLLAVDDSVGKLLNTLEETGQLDNTLVIFMGDNGFQFGEHGLIDKRTAYEASIRVPLLMRGPRIAPGRKLEEVVANIDIAPTLLAVAGIEPPSHMQGRSFLPLLRGEKVAGDQGWRSELLYEYYWERNYPQTPTTHAVRTDRYKYIRYHGVWDIDELYDVKNDPHETRNLIFSPEHAHIVKQINARLFELLEATGGEAMPLMPDRGDTFPLRHVDRAKQAKFPPQFIRQ